MADEKNNEGMPDDLRRLLARAEGEDGEDVYVEDECASASSKMSGCATKTR